MDFFVQDGIQRPVFKVPERVADVAGGEAASRSSQKGIPGPRISTPDRSRRTQDTARIGGKIT
jgi:hypothetical protein